MIQYPNRVVTFPSLRLVRSDGSFLFFFFIFGSWEKKLDIASVRLALVGNICLAFLFFPVARGSSVLPLLGLTPESCIKYHIWLGNVAMTLFTAHGICFIIYWTVTDKLSKVLKNPYYYLSFGAL